MEGYFILANIVSRSRKVVNRWTLKKVLLRFWKPNRIPKNAAKGKKNTRCASNWTLTSAGKSSIKLLCCMKFLQRLEKGRWNESLWRFKALFFPETPFFGYKKFHNCEKHEPGRWPDNPTLDISANPRISDNLWKRMKEKFLTAPFQTTNWPARNSAKSIGWTGMQSTSTILPILRTAGTNGSSLFLMTWEH